MILQLQTLGLIGGLLSLLTLNHFFVDWIFQSHEEAMIKHNNPKVRAKHCCIYTMGFIPLLIVMGLGSWSLFVGLNVLFWSHYYIDTYQLVFLWAKHIRRP